jgi:hypothetical protein
MAKARRQARKSVAAKRKPKSRARKTSAAKGRARKVRTRKAAAKRPARKRRAKKGIISKVASGLEVMAETFEEGAELQRRMKQRGGIGEG